MKGSLGRSEKRSRLAWSWFECSWCHDQVNQDSCLHCSSEQYHSSLPISLVCTTIEAEEDWRRYQCCAGCMSGGSTWHYSLYVTRGESGFGLGLWVLGVYVALGSAWVTYDLHMEKMRCCYL